MDADDAAARKDRIQQDFESVDEVNQLMLDAIKAKLAILDHQNEGVDQAGQGPLGGGGQGDPEHKLRPTNFQ